MNEPMSEILWNDYVDENERAAKGTGKPLSPGKVANIIAEGFRARQKCLSLSREVDLLRQELAAERKRRQEVEDLWHQEQQAHTAAVTRAEQAERERDNALAAAGAAREETRNVRDALSRVSAQAEQWGGALKTTTLARERAEADNAALVQRNAKLRAQRDRLAARLGMAILPTVPEEAHPGAALLERLRVLEKVRDLVTKVALTERKPTEERQAVWREMWDACNAADALRVPHE